MNLQESLLYALSNDPDVQSEQNAVAISGRREFVVAMLDAKGRLIGWTTMDRYLTLNSFGAFSSGSAFSHPNWTARWGADYVARSQFVYPMRILKNGLRKQLGANEMPRYFAVVPVEGIAQYVALANASPVVRQAALAVPRAWFSLRHAEVLSRAKGWHPDLVEAYWITRVTEEYLDDQELFLAIEQHYGAVVVG